MPNTKDYNPLKNGMLVSIVGPPGSGKSRFASTAVRAFEGQSFGFIAPSSELASYAGLDMDYELVEDPKWAPSQGSYIVEGAKLLRDTLAKLPERRPKLVVVDTMNSCLESVSRQILSGNQTDNPQTLSNPFTFYTAFKNRATEIMDRLNHIRYYCGAHVVVLWHEDVREVEGLGQASKDSKGQVHWETAKTVMMPGSLRHEVAKWFDLHLYAEPVVGSQPFRCKLTALPTKTQLAKVRLPITNQLGGKELPNDWAEVVKIVEGAMGGRK